MFAFVWSRLNEIRRCPGIFKDGIVYAPTERSGHVRPRRRKRNPGRAHGRRRPERRQQPHQGGAPAEPILQDSTLPGIGNIWVRDNDIATVSFAEAHIEHVETPGQFAHYTLVRTGDTSHALGARTSGYWISYYGPPFVDRLEDYIYHDLAIVPGEERSTHRLEPELVGPRGGLSSLTLKPLYCEEVPGDCGYRSQFRVGEISTITATLYDSS